MNKEESLESLYRQRVPTVKEEPRGLTNRGTRKGWAKSSIGRQTLCWQLQGRCRMKGGGGH